MSGTGNTPTSAAGEGSRPFSSMGGSGRSSGGIDGGLKPTKIIDGDHNTPRGRDKQRDGSSTEISLPARCINPASEVNSRLDTQVEVRVYPCNNSQGSGKKKFTTFTIKPEVRFMDVEEWVFTKAVCLDRHELLSGTNERKNKSTSVLF